MQSIILHIANDDPILCEVEQMPQPGDNLLIIRNPRRRDGKPVHYLQENVKIVVWPYDKVNFVEIVTDEKQEEIITFVREQKTYE